MEILRNCPDCRKPLWAMICGACLGPWDLIVCVACDFFQPVADGVDQPVEGADLDGAGLATA